MGKVRIAEHAGACFGVRRGLDLVEEALARGDGSLYTLGPIIHNPRVVADLEARGARVAKDIDEVDAGSTLVLRTHGVPPEVEERARERGICVIDATCPYVKRVHEAAKDLCEQGFDVLIAGEAGHAEVEATAARAGGAKAVSCAAEARKAATSRVGLVCQTTISKACLKEVAAELAVRTKTLLVRNTICSATQQRQNAAAALAAEVDVMIVVGGRTSANTCHLKEVAASTGTPTYLVESADEITPAWLDGATTVGITAGASTPEAHITEVADRIERLL